MVFDTPSQEVAAPPGTRVLPRVAFYSHDSYGLGHLRRSLRLASSLTEHGVEAEMLLVSGSPRAHFYGAEPSLRIVSIPSVTKDSSGDYVPRDEGSTLEDTIRTRKRILREEVLRFRPDLFIVDHTPTGLRGELLPLLPDLRRLCGTEIVLGLRDVLDEPAHVVETWRRDGTYRLIESLYDQVWVYGCRDVFPIDRLYRFPERSLPKVRYLGYLDRAAASAGASRSGVALGFPDPSRPHLVCMVGGGGDGYPLARSFLEAIALPPERWNGTLVTGPFLSRERRNRLVSLTGGRRNVQMIRFTAHVEELLGSADLLVSMGGYNAVLEAVAFRKRTVIVPRVFPRREQWLRAAAFERLGLVHTLEPEQLGAESLADAIATGLSEPVPPEAAGIGLRLDGGRRFASEVAATLAKRDERRRVERDVDGIRMRA